MGTKPPAAVDGRISMDGRHDSDVTGPRSTTTSSLQGREGGSAFTPKLVELVVGPGFNPACRKVIPTHRLYCCCCALRALASLSACLPVCLHGKTWPPSSMLQACHMLVHHIRNLIHLFLEVAHHQLYPSMYILHRGLARPKFFFLGDGVTALGDCLARLP